MPCWKTQDEQLEINQQLMGYSYQAKVCSLPNPQKKKKNEMFVLFVPPGATLEVFYPGMSFLSGMITDNKELYQSEVLGVTN